jgi:hypothetical protein
MEKETASQDTGMLQLEYLQLDIQMLQKYREEDKTEFNDFATVVQSNFHSIQNNFTNIQANFEKLFATRKVKELEQTGHNPETPPNHGLNSAHSVSNPAVANKAVGTCTLQDMQGKDLNLDGTPKLPYRHPNFGQVTTVIPDQQQKQDNTHRLANALTYQVALGDVPEEGNAGLQCQQPPVAQHRITDEAFPVKPAKMHIPEFDGKDIDSWIQTIEMYFDSARTPLDQRTEVVVSYLQGEAMQWWRGTNYSAHTLPWHRYCRCIGDRSAVTSVCDNVRAFHSLKQTSTVAAYIQQFEAAMNLLRRDNPSLPNDYYINSFISGLHDYIQAHLQCHKPADLQQAM